MMTQEAQQEKPAVSDKQHVQAVKGLMSSCLRVKYNKAGLPKSKQASDSALAKVAEEAGGDEAAFSVGKRLLGCDHVVIDKINAWGRSVDKWRNTFTFSMAADDTADVGDLKKARGERLIRVDDVDDFEAGLVALEEDGLRISKELHDSYEQIMALEKKRLGKEFDPKDYPSKGDIYQVVPPHGDQKKETVVGILRIGRRSYPEITASVRLPKVVLERMTSQAAELMNQSLEVAVADVVKVITETFTTLAKQLVDRTKINPKHGTPVYDKVGGEAEVLSVREELGKKYLLLAWKVGKQTLKEEMGPFTEEEFAALRPAPMDATKKLSHSVIDRLGEQLEVFINLKDRLGAYGSHMDKALDAIRDLIHSASGKTDDASAEVIKNIKGSSFYRKKLHDALEEQTEALQAVADDVKKVRRKMQGSIAQQIAKAQKKDNQEKGQQQP